MDPKETEAAILASGESAALPWHIYMDAMGFGMGLSCLQLTFQVSYSSESTVPRIFCKDKSK
jgi:hypothetical protein